ncbi:hypothetical protein B566_EDAN003901, partial [Ephemera danica]
MPLRLLSLLQAVRARAMMKPHRSSGPLRLVLIALLVGLQLPGRGAKKIPWWNLKVGQEQGMVRYECCGGYHQIPGHSGCTGANVVQTAKHYGARKFAEFIEQADLKEKLSQEGAFTLFAPVDSAFERMSNDLRLRLLPTNSRNPSTILLHVVGHKVTSDEFLSDSLIPSLYRNQQLRLNKFNNGFKTVNCNLIVRKDLQATNGVVHLIDNVLEPYVYVEMNLADAVAKDGRFTELAKALEQTECKKKLQNPQQSYTILAPSDEAFQKLPHGRLERLLNDPVTREALLDNHVIPHPTCLSAITSKSKLKTLGNEKLHFECDGKGVAVNGHKIRNEFLMGQNGLLYMVDDLILPDKAKGVMQLAEQEKLFTFTQLIRNARLVDSLENMTYSTVFAPSEAAMYSLPKEELQLLKDDPSKAREFVMYHIAEGQMKSNSMSADQRLRSMDRRNTLRLQVQHNALGVENAMLEKRDISGMNTCIHVLNKALTPPRASAESMLRTMGNFTYFVRGLAHALRDSHNKTLTILAPTDQAFSELGSAKLKRFTSDRKFMNKIMRNHIIEHLITSNSIKPELSYQMKTRHYPVYFTTKNNKLQVDDAVVTS